LQRRLRVRGFIAQQLLTATSGLLPMLQRQTPAHPSMPGLHPGAVIAMVVTVPCSTFAQGVFRAAAPLKPAIERRHPGGTDLAVD
jgi:hypothetical protein